MRGSYGEQGSILAFFGFILAAIVVVASFSIDQGRGLIAHRSTENLADSLALAAVSGLDGTAAGWQNSKRMLLIALQQSSLEGADFEHIDAFNTGAKVDTLFEAEEKFKQNTIIIDDRIVIEMERGISSRDGFRSLELLLDDQGRRMSGVYGVPATMVTNAVKVTVSILNKDTRLADIGVVLASNGDERFQEYASIVGESLAIRDRDPDVPVAPFAIPACYLLTDLNPFNRNTYQSNHYSGEANCQREVIARSPDVMEAEYSENKDLREGILRSDSYPRPPLIDYTLAANAVGKEATKARNLCFKNKTAGLHMNCKATPIRAFLGAPGANGSTINADELVDFFNRARNGRVKARVGDRFLPIEDSSYLDHGGLRMALTDFINKSNNYSIRDAFYSGNDPGTNFPFRRNLISTYGVTELENSSGYKDPLIELRYTWPERVGGQDKEMSLLLGDSGDYSRANANAVPGLPRGSESFRYTNPMCHTGNLPHDHDLKGKVKKVNVMVLGSEDHNYCDMEALFVRGDQEAQPPRSFTNPVIVGFVEANVFDFRIDRYRQHVPSFSARYGIPQLKDENPFSYDLLYNNPTLVTYFEDMVEYSEDQEDFVACESCENAGFPTPECDDFLDIRDDPRKDCGSRPEPPSAPMPMSRWLHECFIQDLSGRTLFDEVAALRPYEAPDFELPSGESLSETAANCSPLTDLNCLPSCKELCGAGRLDFDISNETGLFYLNDGRVVEVRHERLPNNVVQDIESDKLLVDEVLLASEDIRDEDTIEGVESRPRAFLLDFDEEGNVISEEEVSIENGPWGRVQFSGERRGCMDKVVGTGVCGGDLIEGRLPGEFVSPPTLAGGEDGWCEELCSRADTRRDRNRCTRACENVHKDRVKVEVDYSSEVSNYFEGVRNDIREFRTVVGNYLNSRRQSYDDDWSDISFVAQYLSRSNKRCLPRKLNDCDDVDSASCWESPKDRSPGWGCAGVRMRLSCESDTFLSPTGRVADMRAALVE